MTGSSGRDAVNKRQEILFVDPGFIGPAGHRMMPRGTDDRYGRRSTGEWNEHRYESHQEEETHDAIRQRHGESEARGGLAPGESPACPLFLPGRAKVCPPETLPPPEPCGLSANDPCAGGLGPAGGRTAISRGITSLHPCVPDESRF